MNCPGAVAKRKLSYSPCWYYALLGLNHASGLAGDHDFSLQLS